MEHTAILHYGLGLPKEQMREGQAQSQTRVGLKCPTLYRLALTWKQASLVVATFVPFNPGSDKIISYCSLQTLVQNTAI